MNECQCHGPGYCKPRGRDVTAMGQRICRGGDPRSIAAYFGDGDAAVRAAGARGVRAAAEEERAGPCVYLGEALRDAAGLGVTRDCATCRGTVRSKVFGCGHPGHDGTTTLKECQSCRDYAPRDPVAIEAGPMAVPTSVDPVMNYWRGGA